MQPKQKVFERRDAWKVADNLRECLTKVAKRVQIVGSLRRDRPHVHDIELLYIPELMPGPADLLGESKERNMTDVLLNSWLDARIIVQRPNVRGLFTWGPLNKLGLHVESRIPVDFFSTTPENWWNSLVVRTGGKKSNLQITTTANKMGWSFEAYGSGFRNPKTGEYRQMYCEEDIFAFVGLPYREPCLRS